MTDASRWVESMAGGVAVSGGTYTISGGQAYGMVAYGMGSFTSYAYPAGLNLNKIPDAVK